MRQNPALLLVLVLRPFPRSLTPSLRFIIVGLDDFVIVSRNLAPRLPSLLTLNSAVSCCTYVQARESGGTASVINHGPEQPWVGQMVDLGPLGAQKLL